MYIQFLFSNQNSIKWPFLRDNRVYISGCSLISGQGLCGLTQLRNVEELELTNCPSATKEVCLYLKENMPRCMILDWVHSVSCGKNTQQWPLALTCVLWLCWRPVNRTWIAICMEGIFSCGAYVIPMYVIWLSGTNNAFPTNVIWILCWGVSLLIRRHISM